MGRPEESQLKLHIRTSLSKLKYKLNKSRTLSFQSLQTKIVPSLKDLSTLSTPPTDEEPEPQQTRQFERSIEMARVQIAEMVRRDRHADVWEDLIGELGLLEGSVSRLVNMIDEVTKREQDQVESAKEESRKRKVKERISTDTYSSGRSIWNLWRKSDPTPKIKESPTKNDEQNEQNEQETTEEAEISTKAFDPLSLEDQDRYTKIVRNTLVAEWFIGDEIKELRKLKTILCHTISKELIDICTSKQGIDDLEFVVKTWYANSSTKDDKSDIKNDITKFMDIEDRTLMEIIRKLRGDDEMDVVNDYLNEICDIYRIDLYSTGKYPEEDQEETDSQGKDLHDNDSKDEISESNKKSNNENEKTAAKPKPLDSKKKLNDLDALKKRFDDLKRL